MFESSSPCFCAQPIQSTKFCPVLNNHFYHDSYSRISSSGIHIRGNSSESSAYRKQLFSQSKILDIGQSFFLNVNHDFFYFIKSITRAYKIYAAKKLDEEDIIDINLGRIIAQRDCRQRFINFWTWICLLSSFPDTNSPIMCVFISIVLKKNGCKGSAHRNYLLPFTHMGVEKLLQKIHMTNSTICTNV